MKSEFRPAFRFFAVALLVAGVTFPLAMSRAEEAPAPPAQTPDPAAAHRQDVESWRKDRNDSLRRDDGWLTLVGLFWLDEGENRFGSDPSAKVVLPEGKPVTEMALAADASGKPVVLEMGSLSFFVIQRGDRMGVRIRDKKSPALASFHGIESFPVDGSWRFDARFEPYQPAKSIPIPNVLGMVTDTPSPGAVVFERDGRPYRLDALDEGDGKLFLIFADQTSGKETYGAGRFLTADAPRDGRVVVDFNKAYNPPCALTPYATCPLPPPQNRLALRVEAGEKTFAGGHH